MKRILAFFPLVTFPAVADITIDGETRHDEGEPKLYHKFPIAPVKFPVIHFFQLRQLTLSQFIVS